MLRDKAWFGWNRSSGLYLWLGERQVQFGRLGGPRTNPRWQTLSEVNIAWPVEGRAVSSALYEALRTLQEKTQADALQGQELRVVVADAWVGMACIPWSPVLVQTNTARPFVIDCLNQLGFDPDSEDEIRLDDAPYGSARLAVAYPANLLAHIVQFAAKLQVRCRAVRPLSTLVWDVLSRQGTIEATAIVGEQTVTLAVGATHRRWRQPRLLDVKVASHAGSSHDQSLASAWQRWRLRHPQAQDIKQVRVLDASSAQDFIVPSAAPFTPVSDPWYRLNGNPHWLSRFVGGRALDAMVISPRRRWWHWACLGVAVLAVTALISETTDEALKARNLRAQLTAENSTQSSVQSTSKVPLWGQEELKRIGSVNAAIRQLNMPIESVLQALRPPRDIRVAVIAVETASASESMDSADNTVRITAEAPSSADMTRYAGFVAGRKPFVRAYLIRHEILDGQRARYRFMVEAQWAD